MKPRAGQEKDDRQTIPRIIHQIWISADPHEDMPEEWLAWSKSWPALHPGWTHRVWKTRETADLVAEKYPELLKFYEALTTNVQKSDLARFLILDAYGGFYADLDMECLQPLTGLLKEGNFLACGEARKHARIFGLDRMFCTSFIASVPQHPFLRHTINEILASQPLGDRPEKVMDGTGPLMFTRALKTYPGTDVTVLEPKVACPFDNNSRELHEVWLKGPRAEKIKRRCVRQGTYGIHYWSNSWGRGLAGSLFNPHPHQVQGYRFYQGWDSIGYDLANVGRNIEDLVRECEGREDAVGFNTSGFIKYRLRRRSNWHRIRAWAGNEGLYIKESHLPLIKHVAKSYTASALEKLRGLISGTGGD